MRIRFDRAPALFGALVLAVGASVLLGGCGSSGGTSSGASAAASSPASASSPRSGSTMQPAGNLPTSCSQVTSIVATYIGGVGTVKSLANKPNGVSCEFANAGVTKIVILNMGTGSDAAMAELKTKSATNGRTTPSISGLGTTAFSVDNQGKAAGAAALNDQGVMVVVTTNLPLAQDEALIRQLWAVY
jgi:hypothetical protein